MDALDTTDNNTALYRTLLIPTTASGKPIEYDGNPVLLAASLATCTSSNNSSFALKRAVDSKEIAKFITMGLNVRSFLNCVPTQQHASRRVQGLRSESLGFGLGGILTASACARLHLALMASRLIHPRQKRSVPINLTERRPEAASSARTGGRYHTGHKQLIRPEGGRFSLEPG